MKYIFASQRRAGALCAHKVTANSVKGQQCLDTMLRQTLVATQKVLGEFEHSSDSAVAMRCGGLLHSINFRLARQLHEFSHYFSH